LYLIAVRLDAPFYAPHHVPLFVPWTLCCSFAFTAFTFHTFCFRFPVALSFVAFYVWFIAFAVMTFTASWTLRFALLLLLVSRWVCWLPFPFLVTVRFPVLFSFILVPFVWFVLHFGLRLSSLRATARSTFVCHRCFILRRSDVGLIALFRVCVRCIRSPRRVVHSVYGCWRSFYTLHSFCVVPCPFPSYRSFARCCPRCSVAGFNYTSPHPRALCVTVSCFSLRLLITRVQFLVVACSHCVSR